MLRQRVDVLGGIAPRQQRSVNRRVQRLDPSVQHFGKMRYVADVPHADACRAQRFGCAPGGNEVPPEGDQAFGEVNETSLVGN